MAVSTLLDACARAFAMVSYSDGQLAPAEKERFASFVAGEEALCPSSDDDIESAWAQAMKDATAAPSFGGALVRIRSEIASVDEKATVMRAAQAALVADQKLELQENAALGLLAQALGLDPNAY